MKRLVIIGGSDAGISAALRRKFALIFALIAVIVGCWVILTGKM